MISQLLLINLLPLTTLAHFSIQSPAAREGDEAGQGDFPCGGGKTVSPKRTQYPLTGGPIQLDLGHDESLVQVLLGLGNDPGVNFNITLLPTIQEQGPGDFCIGAVNIPEGVAKDGLNATIQVVTNGESTPGLYNVSLQLAWPFPLNIILDSCKKYCIVENEEFLLIFLPPNDWPFPLNIILDSSKRYCTLRKMRMPPPQSSHHQIESALQSPILPRSTSCILTNSTPSAPTSHSAPPHPQAANAKTAPASEQPHTPALPTPTTQAQKTQDPQQRPVHRLQQVAVPLRPLRRLVRREKSTCVLGACSSVRLLLGLLLYCSDGV